MCVCMHVLCARVRIYVLMYVIPNQTYVVWAIQHKVYVSMHTYQDYEILHSLIDTKQKTKAKNSLM